MAQAGRVHLDTLLCQQLLGADLLQSADNIGVYLPIRSEPDLSACYAQWRAQGRRLALPAFRTTGSVGVAYDQAETSSWAPDVWDMPLSMLLTPSRCIVAMASP